MPSRDVGQDAPFDEHGAPTDQNMPTFVTNSHEWERWRQCVRIAERITQLPDPHPEERMFASQLYFSPIPTAHDDFGAHD